MNRTETVQPEVLVGRGGVVLPLIPEGELNARKVMNYFNDFWDLNSVERNPYDDLGHRSPNFERELVVPAADSKPLVIVKYIDVDTSRVNIFHSNDGFNTIKQEGIIYHQVFVAPTDSVGQMENMLTVYEKQVSGRGHPSRFPGPEIVYKGQELSSYGFGFANEEWMTSEEWAIAYRATVQTFVDIVS